MSTSTFGHDSVELSHAVGGVDCRQRIDGLSEALAVYATRAWRTNQEVVAFAELLASLDLETPEGLRLLRESVNTLYAQAVAELQFLQSAAQE